MSLHQPPGRPTGAVGPNGRVSQPGVIPLRPLGNGEIMSAAVTIVRRHFLPLAGVSLVVSALGTAALFGTLNATGSLAAFVTGDWLEDILRGSSGAATLSIPGGILLAVLLNLVVLAAGTQLTAGLAAAFTSGDTLGRPTSGAELRRRVGKTWPVLLAVGMVTAVAVSLGLMLFIVPGVLIYLMWLVATPAVVMEGRSVGAALRRSADLTTGHRGRLFGLIAGCVALTMLLSLTVTAIVSRALTGLTPTSAMLVGEGVSAVLAMVTTPWLAAVCALAYVDLRIRKEDLAAALAAAAGNR